MVLSILLINTGLEAEGGARAPRAPPLNTPLTRERQKIEGANSREKLHQVRGAIEQLHFFAERKQVTQAIFDPLSKSVAIRMRNRAGCASF